MHRSSRLRGLGHCFSLLPDVRASRCSLEPRRRLEPHEGLACFAEQRLGLLAAVLCHEPLALLEQRHREVEGKGELPEEPARALEQAVGLLGVRTTGRQSSTEARGVRLQELW